LLWSQAFRDTGALIDTSNAWRAAMAGKNRR
jgi:hypothetical protein